MLGGKIGAWSRDKQTHGSMKGMGWQGQACNMETTPTERGSGQLAQQSPCSFPVVAVAARLATREWLETDYLTRGLVLSSGFGVR